MFPSLLCDTRGSVANKTHNSTHYSNNYSNNNSNNYSSAPNVAVSKSIRVVVLLQRR